MTSSLSSPGLPPPPRPQPSSGAGAESPADSGGVSGTVSDGASYGVSDAVSGGGAPGAEVVFAAALGEALRAVRYATGRSQRQLAADLGMSKSALARLEHGGLARSVTVLLRLLERVGFHLRLHDERDPTTLVPADVVAVTRRTDPEVGHILAFWRERVIDEQVRDAAGRRPPAHRHVYPLRGPHSWWVARHRGTPWRLRPLWSYTAHLTWPHYVKRLGRYPPPVGELPVGGAPMQGWPPPEALAGAGQRWPARG